MDFKVSKEAPGKFHGSGGQSKQICLYKTKSIFTGLGHGQGKLS